MAPTEQSVATLGARLDAQDKALAAILDQTTRTNARVTKLEQDQAIAHAVHAAFEQRRLWLTGWVRALIVAASGSAVGSTVYLLLQHH